MGLGIKSLLEIGSRVVVTCPQRADPDTAYVSRLEDLRPEGLAIAVPLWRGTPLLLHAGERVRLQVLVDDAHLEFESTVRGQAECGVRLFVIAYPTRWRRVQRRENVRLRVMLPVEGYVETARGPERKHFSTFDISAGGLGLRSPHKLPPGTRVTLCFEVNRKRRSRRVDARGEVVRVDGPARGEYRLGIRFVEIRKADQDFIVAFIFERLVEQRRLV